MNPATRIAVAILTLTLTISSPIATLAGQGESQVWTVGATGNEARYRVREQLAGMEFENDAVGVTSGIAGSVTFGDDGAVIAERSVITIDLTTLKSDKSRRDGYLRRRTLQTEIFPNAILSIKGFEGLKFPIPTEGELEFVLRADLKVRDRTLPTTWQVEATVADGHITGSATTSFSFSEIGLDRPRVMAVLSVEDKITLEYSFHLIAGTTQE